MTTEFEATFVDIDPKTIRDHLTQLGAVCLKPERLMRRVVFDPPQYLQGGWMRVRDEGDKITLSLKQFAGKAIEDQKEVELIIQDFETGVLFLESIGATRKAYQETKRESWEYQGVKIDIDTWPGLDPFVEIEGDSEDVVKDVAAQLALPFEQALFGPVHVVYQLKLGIPPEVINNQTPEITFNHPPQRYSH